MSDKVVRAAFAQLADDNWICNVIVPGAGAIGTEGATKEACLAKFDDDEKNYLLLPENHTVDDMRGDA